MSKTQQTSYIQPIQRCFTYRFLATGTVEEKIFQRQLSKEGLQSVVDDKEQVNALSTKDLRNLFKLRTGTPSDTHDKLKCERCAITHDNAELEEKKVLPKKLLACQDLISKMAQLEDAKMFLSPLNPVDHGVTKEDYERVVKQPIDLGTIQKRLSLPQDQAQAYKSVSGLSKDVNRIFSNVAKVWSHSDEIFESSHKLQTWWTEEWPKLVEKLMVMKADDDPSDGDFCKPCEGAGDDGDEKFFGSQVNERSDDYQEQIGMPDEENMRSWSHHHRTDTVDDPVFRAAMRGCDAVSFVFGLEVTWSLIQQRQQEEEEAKAMRELNCIQELEDDDDDDDDNGTDDKDERENNDYVGNQDTIDDGKREVELELVDSDDDEETAETEEPVQDNDAPGDEVIDVADAKFASDSAVEDEDCPREDDSDKDLHLDDDSDSNLICDQNGVMDSPESPRLSRAGEAQDSPSSCSVSSKRSRSTLSDGELATEDGDNDVASWACKTCTLLNPLSAKKCSACNAARPPARKRGRR